MALKTAPQIDSSVVDLARNLAYLFITTAKDSWLTFSLYLLAVRLELATKRREAG